MAARVILTKTVANGSYPTDGVALTLTAADITDKNRFQMTGDDVLLIYNSGASPYTFTIYSVANARGRTGDITTESIVAGAVKVLGPFKSKPGWVQSDGYLWLEASNAAVKFAVVKIPRP
jgi:hypothetical protein